MVQDLWLYHRIATIDDAGAERDLTAEIHDLLGDRPEETFDLGGGVTFHLHDEIAARLVDGDGEVRLDVAAHAGVLAAEGDRIVAVLATPDATATTPIDARHGVQIDLTALDDLVQPGDALLADVGFVQAFGDGTDEDGLDGAELLGHRLAAGRVNVVGTTDRGINQMVVSTEVGSAVAGSVWGDLPAKSHRMMDGFTKGFQGCKLGLKCVKNYFDEMVDVMVDFGSAFDCNTGAGRCLPDQPSPPDRDRPGSTTSTTGPPPGPRPRPSTPRRGAKIFGDPHLQTFDGRHYGMQAVGEFVAARSDDLEIQIRTAPLGDRTDVSILTGVAVHAGGHTLSVTPGRAHLDGERLGDGALHEPRSLGDATLTRQGSGFEVTTASGVQVSVTNVSIDGLELWVELAEDDGTTFEGLLGDNDGDSGNDHATRDGKVFAEPDVEELYGTIVDSWRLGDAESHFHYERGESTDTFTDRSLPREAATLASLPAADRNRALAICAAVGIVDESTLDQCALDFALSGDMRFVRAALTMDTVLGIWEGRLLEDGSDAESPGPDDGHGPDDPEGEPVDLGEVRTVDAAWNLTARQLREGDELATRVVCPPDGRPGALWGTDTYSDDSSVCTAAVHLGLITFEDGGEALIEHRPGLGSYRGSTRNGVRSAPWGSWPASFVFIGARGVAIEGD